MRPTVGSCSYRLRERSREIEGGLIGSCPAKDHVTSIDRQRLRDPIAARRDPDPAGWSVLERPLEGFGVVRGSVSKSSEVANVSNYLGVGRTFAPGIAGPRKVGKAAARVPKLALDTPECRVLCGIEIGVFLRFVGRSRCWSAVGEDSRY